MNDSPAVDPNARAEDHIGLDKDVRRDLGVEAEEHRLRGDERHAGDHRLASQARLHDRLGLGELRAIVDPHHLGFRRGHDGDRLARRARDLDHVGQIILALRVRVADPAQQRESAVSADRHQPGVAQADAALLGRSILLLTDRREPLPVSDETSVPEWVLRLKT
jgi:hypothetical protein